MKIRTMLSFRVTCIAISLALITPMGAYAGKPLPFTNCVLTSKVMAASPTANAAVLKAPGGTTSTQFFFTVSYTYISMQGDTLPGTLQKTAPLISNYKAGGNSYSLNVVELKNQELGVGAEISLTSVDVETRYYGAKNRIIATDLTACSVSIP